MHWPKAWNEGFGSMGYDATADLFPSQSIGRRRYPMHWQGVIPGVTPEISDFYLAVCRLHELIRERVWTITFFQHFYVSFRSRDLVRLFNKCMKACLKIVVPRNLRPACQCVGYSSD